MNKTKTISKSPLSTKANILWNTAGNFIYLFCQWLFNYVVVKMLGFYDAGILSLAMTIANSFFVVATYTMRNYQASDINNSFLDDIYIKSRFATCALSLVCCFVFEIFNQYDPYTFTCVLAFMLFKISEALSDVYQGILQKAMRMDFIGISFSLKGITTLTVFVIFLALMQNLLYSIIAITIVSFIIVITYDRSKAQRFQNRNLSKNNIIKQICKLLIACLPLAIYGFLFNIIGQAPRYFIELISGEEALGYYTSVAMPVVIVQVSASFIFSPLITPLAKALSDNKRSSFRSLIIKVLALIFLIAVIALLLGQTVGEPILVLLFGSEIEPYCYLLLPLIGCTIATALSWFLAGVLTVVRKLKLLITISGISAAIVIIGCIPFIHIFGMNGASFIMIIGLSFFCLSCLITLATYLKLENSADIRSGN